LGEETFAKGVGDGFFFGVGAFGPRDASGYCCIVAAGDGGGEERELGVGYACDFFGVFAHAGFVGVEDGEPEFGVGALEGSVEDAIETVVVEDDVEVVGIGTVWVCGDGDVAAVWVAMERGAGCEDHGIEYSRKRSCYFIAGNAGRVKEGQVVYPVTGFVLHAEDSAASPEHVWNDEWD